MRCAVSTNKTVYVILGLLSEQPLSGYEIKKLIKLRFQFFWSESYGQLYPTLKSLVKDNLIQVFPLEKQSNRNEIKYCITDLGKEKLKEWLFVSPEKETIRLEILLKMYFSLNTPEVPMIEYLSAFKDNYSDAINTLNLFQKELKQIAFKDNHEDILHIIDFGQKVYKAYIEWSEETIKYFKRKNTK